MGNGHNGHDGHDGREDDVGLSRLLAENGLGKSGEIAGERGVSGPAGERGKREDG